LTKPLFYGIIVSEMTLTEARKVLEDRGNLSRKIYSRLHGNAPAHTSIDTSTQNQTRSVKDKIADRLFYGYSENGKQYPISAELLQDFYGIDSLFGLNSGLEDPVTYVDEKGIEHKAKGQRMYTKSQLLFRLNQKIKAGQQPCVYTFDIKNLRAADLATDKYGTPAADLLLNQVAEAINMVIADIDGVEAARYGGDEFTLLFDNYDQAIEICMKVEEAICKLVGFYKDPITGKIERKQTELKREDGSAHFPDTSYIHKHLTHKPANDLEAAIFQHFVQNGLLLNTQEIKTILFQFKDEIITHGNDLDNTEKLRKCLAREFPNKFYPKSVLQSPKDNLLISKLRYLQSLNSKLSTILSPIQRKYLEAIYKENFEVANQLAIRIEKIIEYIEFSVFDPLLKNEVGTFSKLAKDLMQKPTKAEVDVELKGTKEINDSLSLVHGDMAILTEWNAIQKNLDIPSSYRQFYEVYRRGSTFKFRFSENTPKKIYEEIVEKLQNLTSITLFSNTEYELKDMPIVVYAKDFDTPLFQNPIDVRAHFTDMTEEVNDIWYERAFELMIQYSSHASNKYANLNQFFDRFFHGKRHEERKEKGLEVLKRLIRKTLKTTMNDENRDAILEKRHDLEMLKAFLENK
jgi:GGDEF domain-containing protein